MPFVYLLLAHKVSISKDHSLWKDFLTYNLKPLEHADIQESELTDTLPSLMHSF